jgi:hypothetical protein
MLFLLLMNLLVTVALAIGFVRIPKSELFKPRSGTLRFCLSCALLSNVFLFVWLGMWKHSPPVFAAEYWKFLGSAAIAAASAFGAFTVGWFLRGLGRLLAISSGALLGILSLLAGIMSIRFS